MKNIFSLFYIFFLISCSTTANISGSDSIIIPGDFFGLCHAGLSATDEEFQLIDDMKAVWLLYTFDWSAIERNRGLFDFSKYDDFVNKAEERGKKVIAILAYSTPWIDEEVKKTKYIPEKYYQEYFNYVETIIMRYKDKIDAWQIWNEPNWIFWKGTNREFFNLSRLTAQKIKEIYPEAYIIGGGILRSPENFIRNMHKAGAMENLDAISFHPYALNPAGTMAVHDNFLNIISKINFTGDVWITEAGNPTAGWYLQKVSLKNQPSYVIKTVIGAAIRGARVLLWYEFSDKYNLNEAPDNFDSELFYGLTYPDRTRKNGAWAYELCANFLPNSQYVPGLPVRENIPSRIKSFCFMNSVSDNTLILWNDGISPKKVKISISSSFTLHNISTGSNSVFSDKIIIDITNEPVFITWRDDITPHISGIIK